MKNIAVIGCGYWGKNLVRNFHELGALAAVCDPIETVAKTFSEKYRVPARSWEDILKDVFIQGVILAVPVPLHAELCIEALEAGKDVFVEKPLALTEAEGLNIKETLQKTSRILLVGHLLQYHPAVEVIKNLLADGTIGNLKYIRSHRFSLGKVRSNENVLWSFAPHDFSVVHSLVQSDIASITAHGQCYFGDKIADHVDIHIAYASGICVEICTSWLHPFKEHKMVIVGTDGMLVFDDMLPPEQKLKLYRHVYARNRQSVVTKKADPEDIPLPSTEPLKAECQHFIDCMRTRQQPRTNIDEGLAVLHMLQLAQESLEYE
jgi:UDP-2-acetamido-3-amino-2,3-dideoxy-glucuronate N-acetyltransferase